MSYSSVHPQWQRAARARGQRLPVLAVVLAVLAASLFLWWQLIRLAVWLLS